MWYWLLKYVVLGPALWLLGRPTVENPEHVPASGPVILAANHLATADSFFLAVALRRRITFVAKIEYFTGRGPLGAARARFFRATGQIPVDRGGGAAGQAALAAATRIIEGGGVWAIYPEGTRSPDGRLYRGRTGVMRVALATRAPVVPVVVRGTRRVNPPGRRAWRHGRVRITVCEPLDLSDYHDRPVDRTTLRAATDTLMRTLAARSGQEYVDVYARRPAGSATIGPDDAAP
jgi:1-acyl-sn-glycerol-3-phosphate acyltransferase